MKWPFSLRQKTKTALLLGAVFLFIFAKNWLDQKNVSELGNSFSSVYEDRLLAESYIYKLSHHLYQKKILFDQEDENLTQQFKKHNAAINAIILDYEKTKLTDSEQAFFQKFKSNLAGIKSLEATYLNGKISDLEADNFKQNLNNQYANASNNLHQLSEIQVAEGKILNDKSKQIIAGSNLLKDFEFALLMGLALIVYSLVLTTKSVLAKIPYKPSLN